MHSAGKLQEHWQCGSAKIMQLKAELKIAPMPPWECICLPVRVLAGVRFRSSLSSQLPNCKFSMELILGAHFLVDAEALDKFISGEGTFGRGCLTGIPRVGVPINCTVCLIQLAMMLFVGTTKVWGVLN